MKNRELGLCAAALMLVLMNCPYTEGKDRDLYIRTSSSCRIYDLDDDEISVIFPSFPYFGLDDCQIKINDNHNSDRMCVKAKDLDLDCGIELEAHAGIVTSFPDKTYTCSTSTDFDTEYCTYLDSLTIIVKQTSRSTTSSAKLKVYPKGSEFDLDLSDIAETAVMGVYVIVGLVVGGIILLIIVVVIVICCCCKRQGASSGQVYRNQQPASQPVSQPPPSAYPQVQYSAVSPQAAGYQPPPAQGYNPTPQGYNPPPGQMAGYPPQAGYQPPPQGYGAPPPAQGYQMAETQKMPSAPMLEKDPNAPPPYPGM